MGTAAERLRELRDQDATQQLEELRRSLAEVKRQNGATLAEEARLLTCVSCRRQFTAGGTRDRKMCGRAECQRKYRNARRRKREHLRRTAISDVTPEQELAMRRRARNCPLCRIKMTSKPGLPNSKHLDHIVPIAAGGTHTHGNLRVICRTCNLSRPKDGSDFTGQLTLWAQGPVPVTRSKLTANHRTCRNGLHPWVPANILVTAGGKKLCKPCRHANDQRQRRTTTRLCQCGTEFSPPNQHATMCQPCADTAVQRAVELHAAGGVSWKQVAREVGYGSGWGIAYAAKRAGYEPGQKTPADASNQDAGHCEHAA